MSDNAAPSVFISIGRPLSKAQEDFKLALISAIKARGLVPRTVGARPEDSDVPHDRPIEQIRRVLTQCDGAVVVGYEKHMADKLRTNSPAANPGEMSMVRFPTSWNQAEAAMAFYAGMPLLLITEEGVYGECILEDGVVGAVARLGINAGSVWDDVFQRRITSWAADVAARARTRRATRFQNTDAEQLTLRDIFVIFSSLKWRSLLAMWSTIITVLGIAYGLGFAHLFVK